jgi:hypothetical protein
MYTVEITFRLLYIIDDEDDRSRFIDDLIKTMRNIFPIWFARYYFDEKDKYTFKSGHKNIEEASLIMSKFISFISINVDKLKSLEETIYKEEDAQLLHFL